MELRIEPFFKHLLQPLSPDERGQLEQSILKEGCHDALIAWSGTEPPTLLDGHNRYDICTKNSVAYRVELLDLPDEATARNRVIAAQLARRNITPEQASYLRGLRYNAEKGQHGGDRASAQSGNLKTCERIAAEYNVGKNTIKRDGKFAESLNLVVENTKAEVKAAVLSREKRLRRNDVNNLAKQEIDYQQEVVELVTTEQAKNYKEAKCLIQARLDAQELEKYKDLGIDDCVNPTTWIPQDMQTLLTGLRDLDAIITDPPYPEEFVPLYGELARLAKDAMKPEGILAVMCGQSYIPQILNLMVPHLPFRWITAYLTPGGQAVQLWDRKVNTFWKPILLFGGKPDWIGDVVKSKTNDNDKRFHHWGQSESGMLALVESLSKPGETVCDPFMGAGTTGVVCVGTGRKFVGCDINEEFVSKAKDRMRLTKGRMQAQ